MRGIVISCTAFGGIEHKVIEGTPGHLVDYRQLQENCTQLQETATTDEGFAVRSNGGTLTDR
eukprot:1076596-Alexandrium_andersonii.AAC.1